MAISNELEVLRLILNSLSEGVVVADRNGAFLLFNPVAERILGIGAMAVDPAEWTDVYGCFRPDRVTPYPAHELPLARAIRGEEVTDEEIFIRNRQVREGVLISISARPLTNGEGEIHGGVVLLRDITASRRALEEVQRLSSAVEQTADCVLITDLNGVIEYVNPAFQEITGYSREEVLGRSPRILKSGSHTSQFYRELWETILRGDVYRGTIINQRKNGEIYWSQQTITPMKNPEGKITHFVSVLKDITEERKHRERKIQMRLARAVQQSFYRAVPKLAGFDIAGAAYPADETGGDYFDFIPLARGCLGITIGDVSGHGLGSALVMAETRAYLRSFSEQETDVGKILEKTNRVLAADLDGGRYVTLLLVRLDPESRSLIYASAGHVSGYLLDEEGEVESTLESTGLPLGLFADSEYETRECGCLDRGKVLVLVTDGIAETRSPEGTEFGVARTLETLRRHRQQDSSRIMEALHRATSTFRGRRVQDDDLTYVVCQAE